MTRWLNSLQPWGVVLLRYVLGVAMLHQGWNRAMPGGGFHRHNSMAGIHHFSHALAGMGVPYWVGYVVLFAEVVGGACLLVGLFVRFFALLIAGDLAREIFMVTWHHGYSGSEYQIALLAMAIMLLLTGPGRWALDRRMGLI